MNHLYRTYCVEVTATDFQNMNGWIKTDNLYRHLLDTRSHTFIQIIMIQTDNISIYSVVLSTHIHAYETILSEQAELPVSKGLKTPTRQPQMYL